MLTLLSSTGLGAWFLQQQYDARSADFRILYREITVKVSQHDAIIPLLPSGQNAAEVQQILPQIVQWRRYDSLEPRRPIVAQSPARYLTVSMRKRHSNILPFVGTVPRCLRTVPHLPTPGGAGRKLSPAQHNLCSLAQVITRNGINCRGG